MNNSHKVFLLQIQTFFFRLSTAGFPHFDNMGRPKSEVWDHYNVVSNNFSNTVEGRCKYCDKHYVSNKFRMMKHLARECPECSQEVKDNFSHLLTVYVELNLENTSDKEDMVPMPKGQLGAVPKTKSVTSKKPLNSFVDTISQTSQARLSALYARAMYASGCPFNLMDNSYWNDFFHDIRPAFKKPSRYQLANPLLDKEYEKVQSSTLEKIRSADSVTMMSDGWTNVNQDSIINIMVATPEPVFYSSVPTEGESHTGVYIADILGGAINDIGSDKVKAVVTDNARNMVTAWKELRKKFPYLITYGCLGHGLNLLLSDVCKIPFIAEFLEEVKEVILYFKSHEKPRQVLKQLAAKSGEKMVSLKLTVPTRWQSQRESLRSILRLKYPLKMTIAHEEVERIIPETIRNNIDDHENYFWKNTQKIYNMIAPVSLLIKNIEGDKPNLSYFPTKLRKLKKFLLQAETLDFLNVDDEDQFTNTLADRHAFMFHPVQLAAHLLNPKLRTKNLNPQEEQQAIQYIIDYAKISKMDHVKVSQELGKHNCFITGVTFFFK